MCAKVSNACKGKQCLHIPTRKTTCPSQPLSPPSTSPLRLIFILLTRKFIYNVVTVNVACDDALAIKLSHTLFRCVVASLSVGVSVRPSVCPLPLRKTRQTRRFERRSPSGRNLLPGLLPGLSPFFCNFLDTPSHLSKRSCRSVRPSIRRSVRTT